MSVPQYSLLNQSGVSYTCRVSSTLNRDTKQFGKKYLFDGQNETCWNSDQVNNNRVICSKFNSLWFKGSPQWVSLEFEQQVSVSAFSLQFQGGFVGKECEVETEGSNRILEFFPEDSNKFQTFHLKERVDRLKKIRFAFNSSSDFYGRITIYKLELYPWKPSQYLGCDCDYLCCLLTFPLNDHPNTFKTSAIDSIT